jgi:hypothetical protein
LASPKSRSGDTKLRAAKKSSRERRRRDVAMSERGTSRERPNDIPESKTYYAPERKRIGEELRLSSRGNAPPNAKQRSKQRNIVSLNGRRMHAKSHLDASES